ncbi:MAG: hypothetical protein WC976_00520 [Caldisericia bacterium]
MVYRKSLAVCDAGGIVCSPENGSERLLKQLIYEEKNAGQRATLEAADSARRVFSWAFGASGMEIQADSAEIPSPIGSGDGIDAHALGKWMASMSRNDFVKWISFTLESLGYKRTITTDDLPLLPYVTSAAGYMLAKSAGKYVTDQKWQKNDTYDARYCVAASQADILVTSDEHPRRTCSQMPYRPFRIGGVEELERILILSSSSRRLKKTL